MDKRDAEKEQPERQAEPRAQQVEQVELFHQGVELFNDAEYFECHEVLEKLWNLQTDPDKQFTQGLIQIAVGLYHLRRDNLVGAEKLIRRGLGRVRPFEPVYAELDIITFATTTAEVLNQMQAGIGQRNITFPTLVKSSKS